MGTLEIILYIIIFLWLIDLSRSGVSKSINYISRELEELKDRVEESEEKWEEKFGDVDSDIE